MRKTKKQLVQMTTQWLERNEEAYRALREAARRVQERDKQVPVKFLVEVMRYSGYLGQDTMHRVVDMMDGVRFEGKDHKIPNEITAGLARKLHEDGIEVVVRKSKFDEPDDEFEQLALFGEDDG